jgi:CubicO group peptidase (beta-lactamase class C family)
VVLAVKDGRIAYHKAFGSFNYDKKETATIQSVYDMASVTKVCATTLAIMKLYDQDKISLDKTLGDYLPAVKGTTKEKLLIKDLLLHQAGLVSFIPFYKEIIDSSGTARHDLFTTSKSGSFSVKVADSFYMKKE